VAPARRAPWLLAERAPGQQGKAGGALRDRDPRPCLPGAAGGKEPGDRRLPPSRRGGRNDGLPAHDRHRRAGGAEARCAPAPAAARVLSLRPRRSRMGGPLPVLDASPPGSDLRGARPLRFPEPLQHPPLPDRHAPSRRPGPRGAGQLPQRSRFRAGAGHRPACLLVPGGPPEAVTHGGGPHRPRLHELSLRSPGREPAPGAPGMRGQGAPSRKAPPASPCSPGARTTRSRRERPGEARACAPEGESGGPDGPPVEGSALSFSHSILGRSRRPQKEGGRTAAPRDFQASAVRARSPCTACPPASAGRQGSCPRWPRRRSCCRPR
jgi:hypothetical protein